MIIAVSIMGKVIHALGADKDVAPKTAPTSAGAGTSAATTAAITAAVNEYRKN
jgi:oxaloacetate decarboxylase gamma subunit